MKYIRWLESHMFAVPDEKTPNNIEKKCTRYTVEQTSLGHIRESFLPIASAFSSKNFTKPSAPPVTTKNESHCSAPLMSRPRPIAQNGTEKSFFSRGTIPTENINLPTRTHTNYRPSYSKPEKKHEENPEEKIAVKEFPNRYYLIDIILEMYPSMRRYAESRDEFQGYPSSPISKCPSSPALRSESSRLFTTTTIKSHDTHTKNSLTMNTIPAYVNLPTPPISPFKSMGDQVALGVNSKRALCTTEESEFLQIQSFLIKYINLRGNQLSKNLKLRIMECYSITSTDIVSTCGEEDTGKFEKQMRILIKVLKTEEPEKWLEIIETDELNEFSEIKSNTLVWRTTDLASSELLKMEGDLPDISSSQIIEKHSDTNLVRCKTQGGTKNQTALSKITSSTLSNKKLPSFNLRKTYDKTFRNERNVIRRAVSGVLR